MTDRSYKIGMALRCASREMKGNREVVMAAVSNWGTALQFATEEMKGDHEIVTKAVSQNGYALHFASEEMRGDAAMIEAALANSQGPPLIALRVHLLSGKSCNQIFNMLTTMRQVLHECADLLGS